MDQSTSNTLRTLGIIATCIVVGLSSLFLLLLAVCGALLIAPNSHTNPKIVQQLYGVFAIAVIMIVIGVVVVSKLARGILRNPAPPAQWPASGTPVLPPMPAPQPHPARAVVHLDPAHLSPASRAAIRQLTYAVAAYIGVIVLSGLFSLLFPALRLLNPGFPSRMLPAAVAYRLSTAAPYAVLLYALAKHPGPRAFAYSLIVPAVPLLSTVFTFPLLLAGFATKSTNAKLAAFYLLFLAIPVVLNAAIAYFGWGAIQKTGIHPPPKRLIIAALVIFFYDSMSGVLGAGLTMALMQRTPHP